MVIFVLIIIPFSYENQNQTESRELDIFNRIILFLRFVIRSVNEDEYENYNSQESYESGKKGVFA
jgi:hypothetical protein